VRATQISEIQSAAEVKNCASVAKVLPHLVTRTPSRAPIEPVHGSLLHLHPGEEFGKAAGVSEVWLRMRALVTVADCAIPMHVRSMSVGDSRKSYECH
jgi:hypothetical protein